MAFSSCLNELIGYYMTFLTDYDGYFEQADKGSIHQSLPTKSI